jgi:hypothetical protein
MDNSSPTNNDTSLFSNKNMIIIILISLLILSFLGINLVIMGGNFMQYVVQIFTPFLNQLFSLLGYTTGTVINKSTDVVVDTAKTSIDIASGTLHDIGNIFKNSNEQVNVGAIATPLDLSINKSSNKPVDPKPDTTSNPIQNPITSSKTQWCLVGEYEGRRGCISINESDKCLSGQVFPDQKACLNPTYTNNMPK